MLEPESPLEMLTGGLQWPASGWMGHSRDPKRPSSDFGRPGTYLEKENYPITVLELGESYLCASAPSTFKAGSMELSSLTESEVAFFVINTTSYPRTLFLTTSF